MAPSKGFPAINFPSSRRKSGAVLVLLNIVRSLEIINNIGGIGGRIFIIYFRINKWQLETKRLKIKSNKPDLNGGKWNSHYFTYPERSGCS